MDRNDFIDRTIQLALENVKNGHGGPFGALVVKDGRIIASGANQVTAMLDPTAHAEVVAIRKACLALGNFELTGCEIYCSCEPCPMCLGAIYWARPAHVFFAATASDASTAGFDDSMIYKELTAPMDKRQIEMINLGREKSIQLFREWNDKPDKIDY